MTWITDSSGTHWVDPPSRERRAPAKPKRFATVKVGDWLTGGPFWKGLDHRGRKAPPVFYLVTDHWFDPVAGQHDPEAGMLYAISRLTGLNAEGEPQFQSKWSHTRRGLASQSYLYSPVADPVAHLRAVQDGMQRGEVTPLRRPRKTVAGRPL